MNKRAELTGENIAYHAARVLLLIRICGKPQSSASTMPGIEGRTLLAKLDFFLRYPIYLKKALELRDIQLDGSGVSANINQETQTVESRMVKYLYGPWDHLYYVVLAYLIGKELISVEKKSGTEVFRVTAKGVEVADKLAADAAYREISERASIVYKAFSRFSGTRLKEFIYQNFPEVVKRELGAVI